MNSLSWLTLLALLLCHPALAEPLHIVSEAWPPYIYNRPAMATLARQFSEELRTFRRSGEYQTILQSYGLGEP